MRARLWQLPAAAAVLAVAVACSNGAQSAPAPVPSPAPSGTTPSGTTPIFVGYRAGWLQPNLSQVANGISTVIVSFYFVQDHQVVPGNVQPGNLGPSDIASLHGRGVKVLLSLGGADPANAFVFDGGVQDFEASLLRVLQQFGFDGVDFDDKSGTQAQRNSALETLIPATRTYLAAHGMPNAVITYAAFKTPNILDAASVLQSPGVA